MRRKGLKNLKFVVIAVVVGWLLILGIIICTAFSSVTSVETVKEEIRLNIFDTIRKDNKYIDNIDVNKIKDKDFFNNVSIKVIEYEITVKSKDDSWVYYTDDRFNDCGLNKYKKSDIDKKDGVDKSNWYLNINNIYLNNILYGG